MEWGGGGSRGDDLIKSAENILKPENLRLNESKVHTDRLILCLRIVLRMTILIL